MEKTAKIVVLDDESTIVWALKEAFLEEQYEVASFADPIEALAYVEHNGCDVLLSDIRMPGIDGIEVLKRIKKHFPRTEVIIMTAYGTYDAALDCIRFGAFDFISKPFQISDVKDIVKRAVLKAQEQDQQPSPEAEILEEEHAVTVPLSEQLALHVQHGPETLESCSIYETLDLGKNAKAVMLGVLKGPEVQVSAFMMLLKDILRNECSEQSLPSYVLSKLHKILDSPQYSHVQGRFVLCNIRPKKKDMLYSVLGYVPGFIYRYENNEQSNIAHTQPFKDNVIPFEPGDVLGFYGPGWFTSQEELKEIYGLVSEVIKDHWHDYHCRLYEALREKMPQRDSMVAIISNELSEKSLAMRNMTLPAEVKSVSEVQKTLLKDLHCLEVQNEALCDIVSSVNEVLINAIEASMHVQGSPDVNCEYRIHKKRFQVRIVDQAGGFDLKAQKSLAVDTHEGALKPSGRGLLLAGHLMDDVRMSVKKNRGVNVLMTRRVA